MALSVSYAVQAKPHFDKSRIFNILLKLERERRHMVNAAYTHCFLLSETENRCARPRKRAYMMLRLCEMYRLAPGAEVPVLKIHPTLSVPTTVNASRALPVVTNDVPKAPSTEPDTVSSTALSRKKGTDTN